MRNGSDGGGRILKAVPASVERSRAAFYSDVSIFIRGLLAPLVFDANDTGAY